MLSNNEIKKFIKLKRKGLLSKQDEKNLVYYYNHRTAPIKRMIRPSGYCKLDELMSYYWEGIYTAFIGKKKNGEYYVDLSHPEFMSKIYTIAYMSCKNYFKTYVYRNFLLMCGKCGSLNNCKREDCNSCGSYLELEGSKRIRRLTEISESLTHNYTLEEDRIDLIIMLNYIKNKLPDNKISSCEYLFKAFLDDEIMNSKFVNKEICTKYKVKYDKLSRDLSYIRHFVNFLNIV